MLHDDAIAEDSGYVLEILNNSRAIAFRRADMENPEARTALLTIFEVLFPVTLTEEQLDNVLADAPRHWPYIGLQLHSKNRTSLQAFLPDREPGKNSGKNPVINRVSIKSKH